MTVGGVDTYYDYEEQRWMHRRLGGGPVRPEPPNSPGTTQQRNGAPSKQSADSPQDAADESEAS
jgi:hypothetical protein